MDDIIFRGNDEASKAFAKEMKKEFEMSMIGEKEHFLRFLDCSKQRRFFHITR